jgi:hypothetical protein
MGSSPIGTPVSPSPYVYVNPGGNVTLNAATPVRLLTLGAQWLDLARLFAGHSDVPCVGTIHHDVGCVVRFNFTPTAAGRRNGAVVLHGASGEPYISEFVYGTGTGPQVAFDPDVQTVFNPPSLNWNLGLLGPTHIAVEGAGDSYVAASESSGYAITILFAPVAGGPSTANATVTIPTTDSNELLAAASPRSSFGARRGLAA